MPRLIRACANFDIYFLKIFLFIYFFYDNQSPSGAFVREYVKIRLKKKKTKKKGKPCTWTRANDNGDNVTWAAGLRRIYDTHVKGSLEGGGRALRDRQGRRSGSDRWLALRSRFRPRGTVEAPVNQFPRCCRPRRASANHDRTVR